MSIPGNPFLVYMPTYAPETEAVRDAPNKRQYKRISQSEIADRVNGHKFLSRLRPWSYMDCIDSILNTRLDVDLVVADARSTDSIRDELSKHQRASRDLDVHGYDLALFRDRLSQWDVLNRIFKLYAKPETKYFVYTSSDVIWTHDWLAEAEKEFDADPTLQVLFPCVSSGDPALPCQIASEARDLPLIDPADHMDSAGARAARAPTLNAYAFICRVEFLNTYGGYPSVFRNCFTESFLYYMCEAMGGKMRLMPRGWVYHHNGVDAWAGEGGAYHYTAEKPVFDKIMDQVQEARCAEHPRMCVSFLKELLYV